MANDIYNIQILQGSSYDYTIQATNSDGSYVNLTGYSARGLVKNKYSDSGYLLDLRPVIDVSYVSGIVHISGSGNTTASLPATSLLYDVEVYNSGGYVLKLLRGRFEVLPESTY